MTTYRKNRKIFPASVSLDVRDYLKSLVQRGINASQEVDDAVKAMPGFKQFMKEKEKHD